MNDQPRRLDLELAQIIMKMDLRSERGAAATQLAREILEIEDPSLKLAKWAMVQEILETMPMEARNTMPKLEDLKKNLLTMTPEELRARIREIRADRIIRKEAPKAKVNKAKAKDKTQTDLRAMMAAMTPEEREAFLKELEA